MHAIKTRRSGCSTALLLLFGLLTALPASAQVLGTFTTGAISSEGEGGVFMLAGHDRFRTGASARFRINTRSDIGFQAGLERYCEQTFYGGGADIKIYVVNANPDFAFDISLDGAFAHLRSSGISRNIFTGGLLVSGIPKTNWSMMFEPYIGLYLSSTFYTEKPPCIPEKRDCWLCEEDKVTSETDVMLRFGVRFFLTDDLHLLTEAEVDGERYLGAALNVVF